MSFDDATYSPHILLWIVQAEARHGFRDDAIAAARKLLRLAEAPSRREIRKADLYNNLIETQMKLGDRAGAQETLRRAHVLRDVEGAGVHGVRTGLHRRSAGRFRRPGRGAADGSRPGDVQGPKPENAANLRHDALFNAVRAINANNREAPARSWRKPCGSSRSTTIPCPGAGWS